MANAIVVLKIGCTEAVSTAEYQKVVSELFLDVTCGNFLLFIFR